MSVRNDKQFIFSWKIKNILAIPFFTKSDLDLESPVFRVGCLGNSEWCLHLTTENFEEGSKTTMSKTDGQNEEENYEEIFNKYIICQLKQHNCDKSSIIKVSYLNFCYELVNPAGDILKAYKARNQIFRTEISSEPSQLVKVEELLKEISNWSDDTLIIRCYMVNSHDGLPQKMNDDSLVGCEADTICYFHAVKLKRYFKFSNSVNWSENRSFNMTSIPFEIIFKYVGDKVEIEISSNIEDEWEHQASCLICIIQNNGASKCWSEPLSEIYSNLFSKNNQIWQYPIPILNQDLEQAECFTSKELKVKVLFWFLYSSKINYPKNRMKNSSIKINKNDTSCMSSTSFSTFEHVKVPDINGNIYLQQDLLNLLRDKEYVDMKLRADDEVLYAHKSLLAVRSSLFPAMLRENTIENRMRDVYIPDIEAKTIKKFLEYVYTGKIRKSDEVYALDLLLLADNYKVRPLIKKYSTHLLSVLHTTNAHDILQLADDENNSFLKSYAIEYIVKYSKEISSSTELSEWAKNNPALAAEAHLNVENEIKSKTL